MKFAEYAPLALKTAKQLPHDKQVRHACLGMFTEGGELADVAKKHVISEKPLDKVNGMEETGDVCWYFNLWCDEMRISPKVLDDVIGAMEYKDTDSPLDEHAIAIGQLVAALSIPAADRGASDQEAASVLVALLASFVHRMGYHIYDSLDRNHAKLSARYASGAFTPEQSVKRDVVAERVILEDKTALNSGDLADAMLRGNAGS